MNQAIDQLIKYLRLEVKRGFDNRAVLGGLERMLEPWKSLASEHHLAPGLIEVVTSRLRDYGSLSENSRRETLQGLWIRLRREIPELTGDLVESEAPSAAAPPPSPSRQPAAPPTASGSLPAGPPRSSGAAVPSQPPISAASMEEAESDEADDDPPAQTPRRAPATEREHSPGTGLPSTGDDDADEPDPGASIPQPGPPAKPPAAPKQPPASMVAPLTTLPGVGPKTAQTLEKLDMFTLGDLLWHLPRRYDDYSQLKTINRLWYGEEVTVIGTVESIQVRPVRGGKLKLVEAVISDGTGSLRVSWFNQAWIATRLKPGRAVVLSGKIDQYLGRLTMNAPEWEPLERQQLHTARIVPVYALTAGITAKWLRRVIDSVVTRLAPRIPDPLPETIRSAADLLPLQKALAEVHFPSDWDSLHQAQHRLAFDEMFMLQLGVLRQKKDWEELASEPLPVDDAWLEAFLSSLPFALTTAQKRALDDLRSDMLSPRPMNRLLQGDVGSGKTVIAAAAMAIAAANGRQSALLAPTSILAEQHFESLRRLLGKSGALAESAIRLMIGGTPESEKEEIRQGLADGSIQAIVGTHALLEGPVVFKNLALAVIDEQHRFGVEQRATLRAKGDNPNLLVMTATPIPRSLALTIFGDLELSVIDELPPGRQPIETRTLRPLERNRAYSFINSQLREGRQAFIVYPLVEDSEKSEAKAAVEEHQRLQAEVFPDYQLGLLHGRLKAEEKEEQMQRFRRQETQVLVSTSVVELGVDVPNATVMLVEGANHFGLAQLHQFRGRVGRGSHKSYTLLIPDSDEDTQNERLQAMEKTADGFELADIDLKQRGPGDFLGTRQSGFAELRAAQLTDVRLIEKARRHAQSLFALDPQLALPEHRLLAEETDRFWRVGKGEIS